MSGDVLTSYTIYGRIAHAAFQQCTEAAAYVNRTYAESFAVTTVHEVPRDYDDRRAAWAASGALPSGLHTADVIVLNTSADHFLSAEEFLALLANNTNYTADAAALVADSADSYASRAQQEWLRFLAARDRQYCWLDVSIDGAPAGRLWLELFSTQAPLTCKNFCELCRGFSVDVAAEEAGPHSGDEGGATTRRELGYKGTTFFRTLRDAWVMAGDVSPGHSGGGGYSCFGRTFPDETFAVPHNAAGVLGMCNDGPHTNASSFYITRRALSWMNRKYVAFGRVMDGMSVVDAVHAVEVKHNQSPVAPIVITDCGVLDPTE